MNRSRLMKDKRRGAGPLRSPFVMTFAVGVPAAAIAMAAGCGQSKPQLVDDGQNHPTVTTSTDGACAQDGATRTCHTTLSKHDGILSCFAGTQTCAGGLWSACGGTGVVTGRSLGAKGEGQLVPANAGSGSGALHTQSLSDASTGAASCVANPCNPYCVGFEEDAGTGLSGGITPDGGGAVTFSPPVGTGNINGGFRDKLFSDQNHDFGDVCDNYATMSGGSTANRSFFACQADFYCDFNSWGGTGNCKQFSTGQTQNLVKPVVGAGVDGGVAACVDLTIGVPCNLAGANTFPICNRGTTTLLPAMSTTGKVSVDVLSPSGLLPTTTLCNASNPTPTCSIAIPPTGILPGTCIGMPYTSANCTSLPGGNNLLYVNADYAVPECSFNPVPVGGNVAPQPVQAGCANNWSDNGSGNNPPACGSSASLYASRTYTQTYTATCPSGTGPVWGLLTYNSVNPVGPGGPSSTTFSVKTAPLLADGGVGTFTPPVQVALAEPPIFDPDVCSMAGPTQVPLAPSVGPPNCSNGISGQGGTQACCPKDITSALITDPAAVAPLVGGLGPVAGKAASQNPVLQLVVVLDPSPDGLFKPTLYSWQLTYSCVPNQ